MLEPGMFSRGKDPPGRLQLVNLAESLQPGMIDDLLLGYFVAGGVRSEGTYRGCEGNIPVNRVVA